MNIFVLDLNPYQAARDHCDKHVVKMILEYGQMLSTSHRLLDGNRVVVSDSETRVKPKKLWLLGREYAEVARVPSMTGEPRYKWVIRNSMIYQVAHANHPCSVWARQTDANYHWLYQLFDGCLREYTARYGKAHSAERLKEFLLSAPKNIQPGTLTPFAQAMPNEYKTENAVEAYRSFYVGAKARFAKWKNTEAPTWFNYSLERQNATSISGTA